jgi:hypothetical protein
VVAYHVVFLFVDVAVVVAIGLAAVFSGGFHFPGPEFSSILVIFFVVLAICHLIALGILFIRRNQTDSLIREFLGKHGVRILFLWSSLFFVSSISSAVHVVIGLAHGCASGEFISLVPLNSSISGFDFLFEYDSSCVSCAHENDMICSRLCNGNHTYEGGAIIPLLIFVLTIISVGIPALIYRTIQRVSRRILKLCQDYASRIDDDNCLGETLEDWPAILYAFHNSTIEFVKPYRIEAMQWPLWQLLNPVIPLILEEVMNANYEIGGEIFLVVYGFLSLALLFYLDPYFDRMSRIENIILEVTNLVLSCIPLTNRYFWQLPEVLVEVCGTLGLTIPFVLMFVLLYVRSRSPPEPVGQPPSSERVVRTFWSVLDDFIDTRRLTFPQQLTLIHACQQQENIDRLRWLTHERISRLPLQELVSAMSILRCSPSNAIELCQKIGLDLTDPRTASISDFGLFNFSFRDQLRIADLNSLHFYEFYDWNHSPVHKTRLELMREFVNATDGGLAVSRRLSDRSVIDLLANHWHF